MAPTPATAEETLAAARRLGFEMPANHEADYLKVLERTDQACELVLSQPGKSWLSGRSTWYTAEFPRDYLTDPRVVEYPRTNVHLPKEGPENPYRAWAWRADAGDALDSKGKLLSGKTAVFKDTVCMAEVPLLFGTDAFENYVRE